VLCYGCTPGEYCGMLHVVWERSHDGTRVGDEARGGERVQPTPTCTGHAKTRSCGIVCMGSYACSTWDIYDY
jgi:hypothetical protein